MTVYTVFEPTVPRPGADPAPTVVAEKFSWLAALLPPVFLLLHGLWLALLAFVVAVVAIAVAGLWIGGAAAFWLYVLLAVFLGFDAPALRRSALRRRGLAQRAELIAPAADLAQLLWLQRQGRVQ